jgi:large subunit ribosomal protein L10
MRRQEKAEVVADLRGLFDGVQAMILTHYSGLDVASMVALRAELRKVNAGYRVMKNTLARLAMFDSDLECLNPHLVGQTGVAYTHDDPAAAAKVITAFAKEHPALEVRAGYLDGGKILDNKGIIALSKLPSRDELRAQLLSSLNGVARNFVSVLAAPPRDFVGVLAARQRTLESQ